MSKKILVTGATGYIGSHLMKALAQEGMMADGIDFNIDQNDISLYCKKFFLWDIRQPCTEDISGYDVVVHLAAKTMVEPSVHTPRVYYDTNVLGTANLLDAIGKPEHFLYCSTGAAWSPGASPYATSKKAGEDLVMENSNYSIIRFYNVSGNNGFKKYDDSYYNLLRKAAAVARGKFPFISVYGVKYDTRDGSAIRNYTHIDDIVNGIVEIIKHGPTTSIENLGSSRGYSVIEVIEAMKEVTKKPIEVVFAPRRLGDIQESHMPQQSRFFTQTKSLYDQCLSAYVND